MTAPLSALAVQNAQLLVAIDAGPAGSAAELADRAQVGTNLHRKLDSLEAEGLIERADGAAKHEVRLSLAGLLALALARGAVPLARVRRSDFNPRTDLEGDEAKASIEDLAQSIAQKGLKQPILVRPKGDGFEIVAGERRWRAAKHAVAEGWLPADYAIPTRIEELSDDEAEEAALIENVQREDLHWLDEAEAFMRLNDKGKSGAQIEQLAGRKGRKKRSIQELIALARGLAPEDKARARLADTHRDRLLYEHARHLIGHRAQKPAADLGDKLALTLLELAVAGELRPASEIGDPGNYTQLAEKPKTGALVTLQDKALVVLRGFDGKTFARAAKHTAARKPLEELGFFADAPPYAQCLRKARARVVGEDVAGAWPEGVFATKELNLDKAPDVPSADDGLFGEAAPPATPEPPAKAEPSPYDDPAVALVVVELAHKIVREGIQQHGGAWTAEVDAAAMQLDPTARALFSAKVLWTVTNGRRTFAALTNPSRQWLDGIAAIDVAGLHVVRSEAVYDAQRAAGVDGDLADGYATAWLNAAPEADADAQDAQPDTKPFHYDSGRASLFLNEAVARSLNLDGNRDGEPPAATYQSAIFDQIRRSAAETEAETAAHGVRVAGRPADAATIRADGFAIVDPDGATVDLTVVGRELLNAHAALRHAIHALGAADEALGKERSKKLDGKEVAALRGLISTATAEARAALEHDKGAK